MSVLDGTGDGAATLGNAVKPCACSAPLLWGLTTPPQPLNGAEAAVICRGSTSLAGTARSAIASRYTQQCWSSHSLFCSITQLGGRSDDRAFVAKDPDQVSTPLTPLFSRSNTCCAAWCGALLA